MRVSVIVPNYNHAKYLRQRIDSILNQTCQDFELIILDDCSTDDSRTIIDEYMTRFPGIKSFYNSSNSGSAFKQWDFGVDKANGEFIWIAESDDYAEPGFLEKSLEILAGNENIGFVYCNSKIIDELNKTESYVSDLRITLDENKWSEDYSNKGLNEVSDYLYLNNTINNVSGVLFRKKKYVEAGYADHSMKYCGDWFLYIRILLISDIAYFSSPLNIFRFHANSSIKEYFRKSSYFLEVIRVYLFLNSKIHLAPKKRLAMGRILLGIIYRKLSHGSIPEFYKVFKILIDHKRQNK